MYCYLIKICKETIFWDRRFGTAVWEPSPSVLGGHADAPKTGLPAPLLAINLGASVEML
jgi:hypothetical protein